MEILIARLLLAMLALLGAAHASRRLSIPVSNLPEQMPRPRGLGGHSGQRRPGLCRPHQ